MPKSHRYAVVLESPSWGDEADHVRRLRAMLKRLGRGYGMRCVEVKPADSQRTDNESQLTPEPIS